jgi:hypothetical protein
MSKAPMNPNGVLLYEWISPAEEFSHVNAVEADCGGQSPPPTARLESPDAGFLLTFGQ